MPAPSLSAFISPHPDDADDAVKPEPVDLTADEPPYHFETPPTKPNMQLPPGVIKPHRQKAFVESECQAEIAPVTPTTPEVDIFQLFQVIGVAFAVGCLVGGALTIAFSKSEIE